MTSDPPDYVELIDALLSDLRGDPSVTVEHAVREAPQKRLSDSLDKYPDLRDFYSQVDSFRLSWRIDKRRDPDLAGGAEIISSRFFDDERTPIALDPSDYWNVNDEECTLGGKFFPIDIIEGDACVGVFDVKTMDGNEVYFHDYGVQFYDLGVDWSGYIRLLRESMAVRYWQKVILEWEYGYASADADRFEETLSFIDDSPDIKDFRDVYNSIKRR